MCGVAMHHKVGEERLCLLRGWLGQAASINAQIPWTEHAQGNLWQHGLSLSFCRARGRWTKYVPSMPRYPTIAIALLLRSAVNWRTEAQRCTATADDTD